MKRTATEGRKARAEDHAGIDVIGVRHDVVFERALGLIEHGFHQLAAQALKLARVVGDVFALRLALLPDIESFARFLAELALLHEVRPAGSGGPRPSCRARARD